MFRKHFRSITLGLLALSLPLSACALLPESGATPTPLPTPTPHLILGDALVESVDLLILESFPVQVHAVVRGALGDGCTSIDQITQSRQGSTFEVSLTTRRPADAVCTLQLVSFEEVVPLDVANLPAGVYLVNVNGITNTFELSVDNALSATPGATVAGEAIVESVEFVMLQSFPVQVHAVVKGYVPDGCTGIDQITQTWKDNVLEVKITTRRPADAMCTLALVPFEERVSLEVAGLKAGTYTVTINGVSGTFELSADN
jgi:hypothetical protein